MQAKLLLPEKNKACKKSIAALIVSILSLWIFFIFNDYNHQKKSDALKSEATALSQYQSELKSATTSSDNLFLFENQLSTQSEMTLHFLDVLKKYPSVQLVSLEKQKINKKEKGATIKPYLKVLPNTQVSFGKFQVTINGPYTELKSVLEAFIATSKPILIKTLLLNGKNYPKNQLFLELLFLKRG